MYFLTDLVDPGADCHLQQLWATQPRTRSCLCQILIAMRSRADTSMCASPFLTPFTYVTMENSNRVHWLVRSYSSFTLCGTDV